MYKNCRSSLDFEPTELLHESGYTSQTLLIKSVKIFDKKLSLSLSLLLLFFNVFLDILVYILNKMHTRVEKK